MTRIAQLRPSRRWLLLTTPPLTAALIGVALMAVAPAGAQDGGAATQPLACPGQTMIDGFAVSCDGDGAGQIAAAVTVRFRKRPWVRVAVTATASGATLGGTSVTLGPDGSTSSSGQVQALAPGSTGTIQTTTVNLTIAGNSLATGASTTKPKPKPTPKPEPTIDLLSFSF